MKTTWTRSTFLLLWAGCFWWWFASVGQNPYLRVAHTLAVLAILCAGVYLPGVLAWRWKLAWCAAFALTFVFTLRYAPNLPYACLTPAAALNFILPTRESDISMKEAWNFLRQSRQREEERARAIISDHLKKHSV